MAEAPQTSNRLGILLSILTLGIFRFFTVPEGYERIVTAFGKVIRITKPGMSHCVNLWGFYQRPGRLVPTLEQVKDYKEESVLTRDGVECIIDTVIFFKITDSAKAIYGVEDYEKAVEDLVKALLRDECGSLAARELLASRKQLTDQLRQTLDEETEPWGIKVRLVEIKGIEIPTGKI